VISVLSIYVLIVVPDSTPIWLRTIAAVIGAVLGGVFGFFRGKVTPIRTGELPDTIYVGPSLAASLLWVVAFGMRYWVRLSSHQLPLLTALTDALILFPPASYVVMYWMLYRKYERLKAVASPEPRLHPP
jgi:ABC-type dipeptide/oligopeptide/nickel transport system permease subunit